MPDGNGHRIDSSNESRRRASPSQRSQPVPPRASRSISQRIVDRAVGGGRLLLLSAARHKSALSLTATILAVVLVWVGWVERAFLVVLAGVSWHLAVGPVLQRLLHHDPSLQGRVRMHLTRSGLMTLVLGLAFFLLGMRSGANVSYLAGSLVLGALVCSMLHPPMVLKGVAGDASLPARIHAGHEFLLDIDLHNYRVGSTAYGLLVEMGGAGQPGSWVKRLGRGDRRHVALRHTMPRRGLHALPPVQVRSRFPFGLMEALRITPRQDEVLVLPRLGRVQDQALKTCAAVASLQPGAARDMEQRGVYRSLREYREGDNPRHIHWPALARTQQLYVREFEQSRTPALEIVLDTWLPAQHGAEEEERFEWAVSFAASLARALGSRGAPFGFTAMCPERVSLPMDGGSRHALAVMRALAVAEHVSNGSAEDLFRLALEDLPRDVGVCIVTPGYLPAHLTLSLGERAFVVNASKESDRALLGRHH
jgi:uncharacterized protein (DUF58 family)